MYTNKCTTISLMNEYGTYTVSIHDKDLTLEDLFATAIEPVLLAAGYHQDSINSLFALSKPIPKVQK